jgi:hypothetical protein
LFCIISFINIFYTDVNGNPANEILTFGGTLNVTVRGGTAVSITSTLQDFSQDGYCAMVDQAYLSSGGIDVATAYITQSVSTNPGNIANATYNFTAAQGSSYSFEGWGRYISQA